MPLGLEPARIEIVGDDPGELETALRDALASADLVACSGGLGPTHDDRTVEIVAKVAGLELYVDDELEAQIEGFSRGVAERLKRPYADFAEGVRKQATVPAGATCLGLAGTAPGLVVDAHGTPVIVLPGPPSELQRLWPNALEVDAVRAVLDRGTPPLRRTLRFFGPGESQVAQAFQEAGGDGDGLEVTICARDFEIHVDLVAEPAAEERMAGLEAALGERLGRFLYSTDGRSVEEIVLDRCRDRGLHLATAESCTGGLVAARLTAIPGSTDVVAGGIVSYANEVKIEQLGVPPELIERARRRLGGGRRGDGARCPGAPRRRRRRLGDGDRRARGRDRGEAGRARLLPRRDAGRRPRLALQLPGRPRLDPPPLRRRLAAPRAATVGTES